MSRLCRPQDPPQRPIAPSIYFHGNNKIIPTVEKLGIVSCICSQMAGYDPFTLLKTRNKARPES
jgi:hypothetical protein